MAKAIIFNIDEKRGFPVNIGEVELWFDDSLENLSKFFDARKEMEKNDQEINKELGKYEGADVDSLDTKTAQKILELKKESVAGFYDSVFGEGSFKKIYKKYPYTQELEDLITPISESISERIIEREQERTKTVEEKMDEALAKKALKQK